MTACDGNLAERQLTLASIALWIGACAAQDAASRRFAFHSIARSRDGRQHCKFPTRRVNFRAGGCVQQRSSTATRGSLMRIGVRLGPVYLSSSTRGRRRSTQPKWHGKGHTTTPDGREVDFRCHHNHRTQSAALECSATIRKQIERGQSLHLISKVRSTPASREAARQRAIQQEAHHKAKAAERTEAATQRAQRREAAAKERAQRREATARLKHERAADRQARRANAAQHRAQQNQPATHLPAHQGGSFAASGQQQTAGPQGWHAEAVQQPSGPWAPAPLRNEERWPHPRQANAQRPNQRRSLRWPGKGLILCAAVVVISFVLVGIAGNKSHSAVGTTGGGLFVLAVLGAVVCAVAALSQRLRGPKGHPLASAFPGSQNPSADFYLPPSSSDATGSMPYPGGQGGGYTPQQQWP